MVSALGEGSPTCCSAWRGRRSAVPPAPAGCTSQELLCHKCISCLTGAVGALLTGRLIAILTVPLSALHTSGWRRHSCPQRNCSDRAARALPVPSLSWHRTGINAFVTLRGISTARHTVPDIVTELISCCHSVPSINPEVGQITAALPLCSHLHSHLPSAHTAREGGP